MSDKSFLSTQNRVGLDKFYWVLLAALILIAVAERVYGIDRQSLWSDELYAVIASYKGHFSKVVHLMLTDSHPPGYVTFMYFTLPWVGYSDFSIRLHSLIAGILWVPLVFWLGWRWFSQRTGLIAAVLVASSYSAVYYSQEARCYAMLVAVCLLNLSCFLEIIFANNRKLICQAVFSITALFVASLHYSALIFLGIEALILFGIFLKDRNRDTFILGFKLFFLPFTLSFIWIYLTHQYTVEMGQAWAVSDIPTLKEIYYTCRRLLGIELIPGMLSVVRNPFDFYVWTLPLALFFTVYLYRKEKIDREHVLIVLILVALFIIPIAFYFILSNISTPIFNYRYFLLGLPVAALISAFFVDYIIDVAVSKPFQNISLLMLCVVLTTWNIKANMSRGMYDLNEKDLVRESARYVSEDLLADGTKESNYLVLMTHDMYEHYLRRDGVKINKWPGRFYTTPYNAYQVSDFLIDNPLIKTFYYMVLKSNVSDAAVLELKNTFELVTTRNFTTPSGAIEVYKFHANKNSVVTADNLVPIFSPLNIALQKISPDIIKHANNTTMLLTQPWVERYFVANNLPFDADWNGRYYYLESQLNDLSVYFKAHPHLDNFYYVMVDEPSVQAGLQALKKYYVFLDATDVLMPGNVRVKISHFKIPESVHVDDLDRLLAKAAATISASGKNYTTLITQPWLEHYLKDHKMPYDSAWNGRYYYLASQGDVLSDYFKIHPEIDRFYYAAVIGPSSDSAVRGLMSSYKKLDSTEVLLPGNVKVQLMSFSVR